MFNDRAKISSAIISKAPSRYQDLQCPYCDEALKPRIGDSSGFDVLTCRCSSNPVVAGILIYQKRDNSFERRTAEEAIALIEKGRTDRALLRMLAPPSLSLLPTWLKLVPSLQSSRRIKGLVGRWAIREWGMQLAKCSTACDFLDLFFHRSGLSWGGDAYDYFAFRFGQPRHLVGLSFASLIGQPAGPVLDLCCGCGHLTHSLVIRSNCQPVVGVDNSFFALFAAKNWVAPDADYICCQADEPLPFPDQFFSAVFCTDAFHYLEDKAASIREIRRVIRDDGIILLNVLRNAQFQYEKAGQPLSPEGYQALVADMAHCIVADTDVLHRYLRKQGPPLERSANLEQTAKEPLLSLVATQRKEFFHDYGSLDDWPHAGGPLRLNPLYVLTDKATQGWVGLKLQFPSAGYEQDNEICKSYLPETVRMSSDLFIALSRGVRTQEMEALIDQCVLLGIPEGYASDQISSGWAALSKWRRVVDKPNHPRAA